MKKALQAFRELNRERDWEQFHTPSNLAKSICIEAAELLECFQWSDTNYNLKDVEEELADVISYCLQMCLTLDFDPEDIVLRKLEKTKKKYPADKARGRSDKYTVYEEMKEESSS